MCEFKTKIYEAYYPELDSFFYFEEILHVTGKKFRTMEPQPSGVLGYLHRTGGGSLVHLFHNKCIKLDSKQEILECDYYAHFTGPFQKQFKAARIEATEVGRRSLNIDDINFYVESIVTEEVFYLIKGEIMLSVEPHNSEDVDQLPNTNAHGRLFGGYGLFALYFNSLSTLRDAQATNLERRMIIEGDSRFESLKRFDEFHELNKPYSKLSKEHGLDLCRFL